MSPKQIMFAGLMLSCGTIISLTFGGAWVGQEEIDLSNAVSVFKQADILGTWSVMVPNISFFLVGAAALIKMDFAFFAGPAALFQWILLMTLGAGLLWGFFIVVIGVVNGLFGRR